MNWSQIGKKAMREILKQLLLFIISSQMARQHCPCVLGAERQQRPFLCSFVTIQRAKLLLHTKGTRESAGKRCDEAYQKNSSVTQVPFGWQGVILGKDGWWLIQWFLPLLHHVVWCSCQQDLLPVPSQQHRWFLWVVSCWPESNHLKLKQNNG